MGGASLGKLVRQKVILADGFCASMVKIGCYAVENRYLKLVLWNNFGSASPLRSRENVKIYRKIGVTSQEVGVAENKVIGAIAPPTE